ncbi:MAG TPA: FkbM family methyltransferase [Usitatibacter sp.]|nr:FkbM family methyltransferase [Usitatibacter sp.]
MRWGSRLYHSAGPLRRVLFRPARAFYLWAARKREVVVWCGDGYLAVDSTDPVAKWLLSGGFERDEREFVAAVLRPGDLFVDGGAHVGAYTVLAARRVGPQGLVVAFEPEPENRRRLRRSIEANGLANVIVSDLALSDGEGVGTLARDGDNSGGHSLVAETILRVAGSMAIRTTTLDGFLARHLPDRRAARVVLKLDLQGLEARALAGAPETLRRAAAVVIEWTPRFLDQAGDDPAALVEELLEAGFQLESVPQNGEPRFRVERAGVSSLVAALRASGGHVDLLGKRV